MTHLCVSIFVESVEQAKRDIAAAAEAGADLVELRLDLFTDAEHFEQLIGQSILPVIAAIRAQWEGGEFPLNESGRLGMLQAAAEEEPAYIDVELKSGESMMNAVTTAPPHQPGLIVSAHDFQGRPDRLYNIVSELNLSPADVVKIAWKARSIRDNIEAFEILGQRQKPTIAICMGEAGSLSRVLSKKFGAFLTYASLRPESATAPGQPTIHEIKNLYRWDAINRETKVFGVVGSPVAHSLSPAVHNAAFGHESINAVYLPMLVNPGYESFKAFMESFLAFAPLDLSGLSITLPHKEHALRYLRQKGAQIDDFSQRAGAVNTIRISNAALEGFNTDSDAILDTITLKLNLSREQLGELRVGVIGAGGTGRTAVAALAACGATVVVYNRTREKAEAVAAEFDGKTGKVVAARMEKLCDSCCHIFINATPLGMHPNIGESPFGERLPKFASDTLVFDTIYNPAKTRLLEQAEKAGAGIVGGMEMFLHQAARQFEIWTGKAAPGTVMRSAVGITSRERRAG